MTNVIGPIDYSKWNTLRKLKQSIKSMSSDKELDMDHKKRLEKEQFLFNVILSKFKVAA